MGSPAAVSFLQFLKAIVRRNVGPTGFTENLNSHRMFEVDVPDVGTAFFEDDLDEGTKRALVQCSLDASSGLLDLYTWRELAGMIELAAAIRTPGSNETGASETEKEAITALYLMIAIGAQCRGINEDLMCAAKYFSQARKLAFESMLQNPTVNMARIFLLLAFYMFGACRRNAAFMYIGVASKAAVILGLHVPEPYKHMSAEEKDIRLRTGKSVRVFDLICSSILGRPGSSVPLNLDSFHARDPLHEMTHRNLALDATYESSSVLESIVQKLAETDKLDMNSAENFLQIWREWSQALPVQLREPPQKLCERNYREAMIGNIHVACTYYFGIILVSRQFLIQHVTRQLRGRGHCEIEAGKVAELSGVCIDAATYMAQMCCDAAESGILLGNMCIMKAWVFAAGLVLGFSLLAEDGTNSESHEAFYSARRLLSSLGQLSPQATQYYRILTSFSEAIDTYRRQLQCERRNARAPYVERILSLGPSVHGRRARQDIQRPAVSGAAVIDDSVAGEDNYEGSTVSLSDPLSLPSLPAGDEDFILRFLWEGYNINFMDTTNVLEGIAIPHIMLEE